jgi:hypothetical protein
MSTWTTRAPGAIRAPFAVVHRVRRAPKARIRSLSPMISAASGEANPPLMPSENGCPLKIPWPIAEVASGAPIASLSRSSGSRASARTAPRPATITGRCACSIAATTSRSASGDGAGGAGSAAVNSSCGHSASSFWTSSGRLSSTARRRPTAVRIARIVSAYALRGRLTRTGTAPTASASVSCST